MSRLSVLTILTGRPTSFTFADVEGLCYLYASKVLKNPLSPTIP